MSEFVKRRRAKDIIYVHSFRDTSTEIVSKERVKSAGEVYTPLPIVRYMVEAVRSTHAQNFNPQWTIGEREPHVDFDKVAQDKDYFTWINAFVLEPCCGIGHFLEIVMEYKIKDLFKVFRKINALDKLKNDKVLTMWLLLIVSRLHALDILADNVVISRNRVFLIVNRVYKRVLKKNMPYSIAKIFAYLLRINFQQVNSLIPNGYHFTRMTIKDGGEVEYYFFNSLAWWYDANGWHHDYGALVKNMNDHFDANEKKAKTDKNIAKYFSEKAYNGITEIPHPLPLMFDWKNPPPNDECIPFKSHITKMKEIYEHHIDFRDNYLPKEPRQIVLDSIRETDKNLTKTICK